MGNSNKKHKILAVSAAGLVLGVGAAVTLAAWSDNEFAVGSFAAGSFNLEGSTTSATAGFAEHDSSAGAAPLTFTLPLAQNLTPTDTVFAPFWVRLDDTTTTPAELTIAGVTGSGDNVSHLTYDVRAIAAGASCDASASTGTLVGSGAALDQLTAGSEVPLSIGATGQPGDVVQLCFAVTAGALLEEGETATATWQFTAESA